MWKKLRLRWGLALAITSVSANLAWLAIVLANYSYWESRTKPALFEKMSGQASSSQMRVVRTESNIRLSLVENTAPDF